MDRPLGGNGLISVVLPQTAIHEWRPGTIRDEAVDLSRRRIRITGGSSVSIRRVFCHRGDRRKSVTSRSSTALAANQGLGETAIPFISLKSQT